MELPDTKSAPSAARAFVRAHLAERAGSDLADAVGLCVSELVTNAVDHAQPPFRLRIGSRGPFVRIELDDATVEAPVVLAPSLSRERGRGMLIVNRLARSWGIESLPAGKTVWAEF